MIKAELSYNPYLMKTEVKFNGHEPKINSLVEKYQSGMLQTWIGQIPSIFYNEMNGYDFELEFSGTEREYEELKKAFCEAGVSEEQVRIFHKNDMCGRDDKIGKIRKLLAWMEENQDRQFDKDRFLKENEDLFSGAYPLIVVNGRVEDESLNVDGVDIEVESVTAVSELDSTELTYIPIVFVVATDEAETFQADLKYMLERKDVTNNQLFFMLKDKHEAFKEKRIIEDLGIQEPNIISSLDDELVKRYLEVYPLTDFICKSIKVLGEKTSEIEEMLTSENEKCETDGKEIYSVIDKLETRISNLKKANDAFEQRDNLEMPAAFKAEEADLLNLIGGWNSKKTKITKAEEAPELAKKLDEDVHSYFEGFVEKVRELSAAEVKKIRDTFVEWYDYGEFDPAYDGSNITIKRNPEAAVPSIAEALMKLKDDVYVAPKEDLLGILLRVNAAEKPDQVLQVTYYTQVWRQYAISVVKPLAETYMSQQFDIIHDYFDTSAEAYQIHLGVLIQQQTQEKEKASLQLSEEAQLLQADNDWLGEFKDQLKEIERG